MFIPHGVHLQNARKWSAQWCCFYLSCRNERKYKEVDWVRHKSIHVNTQHVHTRSKRNTHRHLQGPVLRRSTRKHNPNVFPLEVQFHPKSEAGGHLQHFTAAFSYVTWAEKSISFGSSTLPPSSLFRKSSKLPVDERRMNQCSSNIHTHTQRNPNKIQMIIPTGRAGRKVQMKWLLYHSVWSQCLFLTLVKPSPLWPIPFDLLWDVHKLQVRKGDSGCSFSCYRAFVSATMAFVLPAGPLSDRNHPVLPAGLLMPTAGIHCPTPIHAQHGSQAPPRCPVRMWWTNCALEESEISFKREQVCAPALSPVS